MTDATAAAPLPATEIAALDALFELTAAAYYLADDTEQSGPVNESVFTVPGESFQRLSDALDKFDELPDDQPGIIMGPAAKAAWALRRICAELLSATDATAGDERRAFVAPYRNWRGDVAERRILPLRLHFGATDWHPEPQWLLTAWDFDRKAQRDFALADFNPPRPAATVAADDIAHLEAETERCRQFVDLLSVGKKSGGDTGTLHHFKQRRDALQRIRNAITTNAALSKAEGRSLSSASGQEEGEA